MWFLVAYKETASTGQPPRRGHANGRMSSGDNYDPTTDCAGFAPMMCRKRQKAARRTIAYVRVSTEDQAREGVSLDA